MIEEPYRWVEAIANRREYVETQLAPGSPIVAISFPEGILFLTGGRSRQKLFEIYDRIAMGAIGHPGDIERLRMTAIELASTEGFTRSAADVSLRRLGHYSLSPLMKNAFEQIYGPPFLARLLFGEVGNSVAEDLLLRVDFDGALATNGSSAGKAREDFATLAGAVRCEERMEAFLREQKKPIKTIEEATRVAFDTWCLGRAMLQHDGEPTSDRELIASVKKEKGGPVEAVLLERKPRTAICYRPLSAEEVESWVGSRK